jgi:hypothetical protein
VLTDAAARLGDFLRCSPTRRRALEIFFSPLRRGGELLGVFFSPLRRGGEPWRFSSALSDAAASLGDFLQPSPTRRRALEI